MDFSTHFCTILKSNNRLPLLEGITIYIFTYEGFAGNTDLLCVKKSLSYSKRTRGA
jgi:hypothetical protein